MADIAAVPLHDANRRLDAIDRKILTVLQEDASLSVAEIGDRVGLSSTPCWKRIQRLEADGVIQKRVALVDQDRIGLNISVFVSIETGDHSQDWLDRFAKTVTAMPDVSGWTAPSTAIVSASGLSTTGNTKFWVRSPPAKPAALETRVGSPSIALASGSGMASLAMRVTCALIEP